MSSSPKAAPRPFDLTRHTVLYIKQKPQVSELLGFDGRFEYEILDKDGSLVCRVSERGDQFGNLVSRFGILSRWRKFQLLLSDPSGAVHLSILNTVSFFFRRQILSLPNGQILGYLRERPALIRRSFNVLDPQESRLFCLGSSFFSPWTFRNRSNPKQVTIKRIKTLSLKNIVLDADQFEIEFSETTLNNYQRVLILCGAIFIDANYFDDRATRSSLLPR